MKWLVLLGTFAASSTHAAGWTQPEGGFYARVTNRILLGEKGYDRHGRSHDTGGRFTDWALTTYGEYGLTDTLTLVGHLTPAGYAGFEDDTPAPGRVAASSFYLGPLSVGARYGRPVGPLRLAVEGRYGYAPPIGDTVGSGVFLCETKPCERFDYTPAVEHHRFDAEVQVGAGLPWGLWLSGSAGARAFAGADLDPALTGFAQLGWTGPWGLVVEAHFTLHRTLGDLETNNIAGTGETRYVGRGFGLSWWMNERIAVTVGQDGGFGIRSNAAAASRTIGVELR